MGKKSKIEIGTKYGKLTVIGFGELHQEPNGHKRRLIKVQCSCGFKYELINSCLNNGTVSKCRNCSSIEKQKYIIGNKYGKLTIIGRTKNKRSKVICKCDCGNEVILRPELLRINKTNSCGCAPNGQWTGIEELSGTFLSRIKRNAKTRNLEFNVSKEYLWQLFLIQNKKCALTNLSLEFSRDTTKPNTASLDRIDNNKGYTEKNVQWVHKDINKMRMDFDLNYFKQLCKLVKENSLND